MAGSLDGVRDLAGPGRAGPGRAGAAEVAGAIMTWTLKDVPDEVRERARLLYLDPAIPLRQVWEALGLSRTAFYERRLAWGWPPRAVAGSTKIAGVRAPGPSGPPTRTSTATPMPARTGRRRRSRALPMSDRDRAYLAADMERFVAQRIAALKEAALSGREPDAERTAREMSHYTRSLTSLRAYRGTLPDAATAGAPDGPPARDLVELRDELRRHLERIWDEERAETLRGEPDAP